MIRFGNAPCSWGTIEGWGQGTPYAQMLDELVATGYTGTELGDWGFMPTDPVKLTAELEARKLKLLASWVSVFLHDPSRHAQSEADAVRVERALARMDERSRVGAD